MTSLSPILIGVNHSLNQNGWWFISVVNLVLNVRYLDVEDLGEDLADDLANFFGLNFNGVIFRWLGVNDVNHLSDIIGFIIQVEKVEWVNGHCGHGVESTREGVDCATDCDHEVVEVALVVHGEEKGA